LRDLTPPTGTDKPTSSVSASQLNFADAQLIGTGSQANIYQLVFEGAKFGNFRKQIFSPSVGPFRALTRFSCPLIPGRQVAVKVSPSSSVLEEVTLVACVFRLLKTTQKNRLARFFSLPPRSTGNLTTQTSSQQLVVPSFPQKGFPHPIRTR
jgi:hypothetical protein